MDGEAPDPYLDLIQSHLADGLDYVSLLLKGHLLIEEGLNQILIGSIFANEDYYAKARLSFYQKIMLMRSLPQESYLGSDFWDAIEALNNLRNRLAHRLDAGNTQELLRKVFLMPGLPPPSNIADPQMHKPLRVAIFYLQGILGSRIERINAPKSP